MLKICTPDSSLSLLLFWDRVSLRKCWPFWNSPYGDGGWGLGHGGLRCSRGRGWEPASAYLLSAGINMCATMKTELSYLLFCSLLKKSFLTSSPAPKWKSLHSILCKHYRKSTSIKQVGIVVPKFLCQFLPSWVSIKKQTNRRYPLIILGV